MKKRFLFVIFSLIEVVCFSQQKEIQLQLKGDTLVVPYYPLYKYIEIGGRVYKIEAPTLTEIKFNNWLGNVFLGFRPATTLFSADTSALILSKGQNK